MKRRVKKWHKFSFCLSCHRPHQPLHLCYSPLKLRLPCRQPLPHCDCDRLFRRARFFASFPSSASLARHLPGWQLFAWILCWLDLPFWLKRSIDSFDSPWQTSSAVLASLPAYDSSLLCFQGAPKGAGHVPRKFVWRVRANLLSLGTIAGWWCRMWVRPRCWEERRRLVKNN